MGVEGREGLTRILCCLTRTDVRELHRLRMMLMFDSEAPKVESITSESGKSVEAAGWKWTRVA